MKLKSLVIAGNHPAVNMSLLLAHTARQTNRVDLERGFLIREIQALGLQGGLSRNKVAVGESAAGSPPELFFLRSALGAKSTNHLQNNKVIVGEGPVDQIGRSSALHAGGLGFKSRRVH